MKILKQSTLLLTVLLLLAITSCKKTDVAPATQNRLIATDASLSAATEAGQGIYNESVAAHLIGFWKFDGNPNDASGRGNNGKVRRGHAYFGAGIPVLTRDRFGRANMCYHFDKGGNIEVPYTKNLNPQEMTISLWSKKQLLDRTLNTDSYYLVAMNRWNGYKLQYQADNFIFFTIKWALFSYYDRDTNPVALTNDVWYHIVVTSKPGEMDFYINGDLVKSWTDTPNPPVTLESPVNFVIGQDLPTNKYSLDENDPDHYVNWGGYFTGDIDDVMFFNAALTAQQVKSIFTRQSTR